VRPAPCRSKRRAEGTFGRCTAAGCQRAGTARPGEKKERVEDDKITLVKQ